MVYISFYIIVNFMSYNVYLVIRGNLLLGTSMCTFYVYFICCTLPYRHKLFWSLPLSASNL